MGQKTYIPSAEAWNQKNGWSGNEKPLVREVHPERISPEELRAVWNHLHHEQPELRRSGLFPSHMHGALRVRQALSDHGLCLVDCRPERPTNPHKRWRIFFRVHDKLWIVPRRFLPAVPHPPLGHTRWPDDWTIELAVAHNPKAKGSKSHARFALYREGMSVGEYVALMYASERSRFPTVIRRDITYDWEHGYIRVRKTDGTLFVGDR